MSNSLKKVSIAISAVTILQQLKNQSTNKYIPVWN